MQRFVTIFITLFFVGIACVGCDYLAADDSCYPTKIVNSCSEYDTKLEYCDSGVFPNVNGCYTVEVCPSDEKKKAAETETDVGSDGEATEDALPTPAPGCHFECQGEPVPCDVLDEAECGNTVYCQWWHDPNNIDQDLE